jgi:hypothetical protein
MANTSTTSSSTLDSLKSSSLSLLSSAESTVSKSLSIFSNNYLSTVCLVLLVAYAPVAAPTLGPSVVGIMGNYAVKFVYIFLLAYLLSKSVRVATLTALLIVVGILLVKKMHSSEHLESVKGESESESKSVPEGVQAKKGLLSKLLDLGNVAPANHKGTMQPEASPVTVAKQEVEAELGRKLNDDEVMSVCANKYDGNVTGYDESESYSSVQE